MEKKTYCTKLPMLAYASNADLATIYMAENHKRSLRLHLPPYCKSVKPSSH